MALTCTNFVCPLTGGQGVAGSNPVSPTVKSPPFRACMARNGGDLLYQALFALVHVLNGFKGSWNVR